MKSSFAPLFFASLLTLTGCTYVSSLRSDVSKQVETLEARQEYGQALEILARVPPSHPEYPRLAQKRIRIEAKAKMYEQATIRRAGELISQNRWTDALALAVQVKEIAKRSKSCRTTRHYGRTCRSSGANSAQG
jgi:hypothetical protein